MLCSLRGRFAPTKGDGDAPSCGPVLEAGVEILYVAPEGAANFPPGILDQAGWTLFQASAVDEAIAFLQRHPLGVVIFHADGADERWRDLLAEAQRLAHPPSIIVSSRLADEGFWAEVLDFGGFDVLLTPFEADEVLRVATEAWRVWKRQSRAAARRA